MDRPCSHGTNNIADGSSQRNGSGVLTYYDLPLQADMRIIYRAKMSGFAELWMFSLSDKTRIDVNNHCVMRPAILEFLRNNMRQLVELTPHGNALNSGIQGRPPFSEATPTLRHRQTSRLHQ
jgi:hypothetical protein